MKKKSCKILPIILKKKSCCVCYEKKYKYVKCTNTSCKDGVICLECLGKFKNINQLAQCQICREKTKIFQEKFLKIKPVEVITEIKKQNVILKKKKKLKCPEFCKILAITIIVIGITYTTGLLFCSIFGNISFIAKTTSPILLMFLGFFILAVFVCIMFCCSLICKKHNKN